MVTKFEVTPRSNIGSERYAGVAILVDGSEIPAALTPNPNTEDSKFDMLSYATGQSLTGTEFKLDWSNSPDGHYAQVEWLEIEYQKVLRGNKKGKGEPVDYIDYLFKDWMNCKACVGIDEGVEWYNTINLFFKQRVLENFRILDNENIFP